MIALQSIYLSILLHHKIVKVMFLLKGTFKNSYFLNYWYLQNKAMIARTPEPPYYAVIFTSVRDVNNPEENIAYNQMATKMDELAKLQPGYLGIESARDDVGITISYWRSLKDIAQWKQHSEHLIAQKMGIEKWYTSYKTRVCLVERDYGFKI